MWPSSHRLNCVKWGGVGWGGLGWAGGGGASVRVFGGGQALRGYLTGAASPGEDLDDETRGFAKRFFERRQRMPNDNQVAVYSAVRHYLEAVKTLGGADDGQAVVKAMKAAPVHDVFTRDGHIRDDGRLVYDRYLMQVKQPDESKYAWDYLKVLAKVPADDAFRPLGTTNCPLTQK